MNVAIYCGSSMGRKNIYKKTALTLARSLALNNWGIVYGGSEQGLMGIISNESLRLGNNVTGVITYDLSNKEKENKNLKTLYKVETMNQRKDKMEKLANAFIILPGGYGTFDEMFEILCLIQLGYHKKPLAVLNIDGYYDKLFLFLKDCVKNGFIEQRHLDMIIVSSNIDKIISSIKNYEPPKAKWEE